MDRRPETTKAREQLLEIQEARFTRRPLVPPVTLERKFISMLNPSQPSQDPTQPPRTAATTATATTTATLSTTVTPLPSRSKATSATTTLPTTDTSSTTVTPLPSATQISTTTAALTRFAQTLPPSPTKKLPPTAAAAAAIVGGKRPQKEESPVIILTQPQDEKPKKETTISDVAGSETVSLKKQPHKEQEQPHIRKQKPEEQAKTLSTRESTSERPKELGRKGGKNGVQFSDVSPKRQVGDVMQFFQEQEKYLQERFLSLPKTSQKKQRSPSPKLQGHAAGLEHLDNLIRLMEQLTSLKDENSKLRKRCDYLESTKILLQAKRDLSAESGSSSLGFMTLPPKHRHHHHHHHHHPHHHQHQHEKALKEDQTEDYDGEGILTRPRISSAEELEYLEFADSSSDQRPKKAKSAMHKRSFSTGSLEVPSEITTEVGGVETRKRIKGKQGRSIFSKTSSAKPKPKTSKWARVKKVLTGQKLYEDLGTTIRTIRELGKSSHIRYSTGGSPGIPKGFSSTSSAISHGESQLPGGDAIETRVPLALAPSGASQTTLMKVQEAEDADLTSDIWMGPPDWWEEYEARKEGGGSPTNSEVSSVIEVTTMYLGSKKESTVSTTLHTSTPIPLSSTSPAAPTTQEKYLHIEKPLSRRQSSPSLVMKESTEEDDILKELTTSTDSARSLHKSQSCKSADLDLPGSSEGRQAKKPHRSAWGRVKDIIHTRKDSIKKKPKRERTGFDSEETSEIDMEALLEEQWRSEVFDESFQGRSTPKSSPMVIRQHSGRFSSDISPSATFLKSSPSRGSSLHQGSSPGNADMAALLAGNMSNEFSRKMQEWEQLKSKKSASFRASVDESDISSFDVPSMPHEFPVRVIDLRDLHGKVPDMTSDGVTPEESNTSMEVQGAPSVNVEEIQLRITDSFTRKMQEWERLKYKGGAGAVREPSPEQEKKDAKGRKDDRQKSKRSREEKEKEKWERQREREMQKVEREQLKLEKEKLRIEKERLRALEREAKLEKLKGRLSQTEAEGSLKNPILSPLAEYKVTADFARKLHEWELKKGLSHDVSNSIYLEAQKISMQHLRQGSRMDTLSKQEQARYTIEGSSRVEPSVKSPPPPPLTLQPYWDSPEDTSPVEKYSEPSVGDGDDDTSVTEECLTKSNIATLERANTQLLENLQKKELEYAAVQEEVIMVNEKLEKVRESHVAEMARFHGELAKGNVVGPVQLEVGELETTMGELEEKIKLMENFGEKLASSMESAAVGKWQSIEGEETVHTQLVELVDQMRGMLVQASHSEEQSQKTMALSNFENLYTQAMKLQVQMNNLRLSHLERNREIMMIKRQLLLQEVNNLLLQADITRRETELYQLREAKRFTSLRRWNTFSGAERQRPQSQLELQAAAARSGQQRDTRARAGDSAGINIPFISEELILASAASSSISAPASPLSIAAAAGDALSSPSTSGTSQAFPSPGAAHEQSTDHTETHLSLTTYLSRRDTHVTSVGALLPQQRAQDPELYTMTCQQPPPPSLHLPRLAISIQPKKQPVHEQSPAETAKKQDAITSSETTSLASRELTSLIEETTMAKSRESTDTEQIQTVDQPAGAKQIITTIYDSVPLHKEIEKLKREKRKVEKGPPTLKKTESEGLSSAPSPEKGPREGITPEVPTETIPKQPSLDKPKLVKAAAIIEDDIFPAKSVMKCTEYITQQTQLTTYSELGAVGGLNPQRDAAEMTRQDVPPTSDQIKAGSTSPRSPLSKHLLRRQREEREAKLKDYRAISPKGSPVAARGKPPLPRQTTASKSSPSASTVSEKGPRSKSVSDIDDRAPGITTSKPLQDAINRFEKRATVCETEDRPVELRKTPSPTLHLPRVGLVSRVRRLKPAAELLEESQRYRSGHSIYATRILQRYLPKEDHKPEPASITHNKENHSGTYVQSIVQRLSRETTPVQSRGPSRANSDISLKGSDSPRAQSEFVASIVRKLSTPSEPEAQKSAAPLKDLTNKGQVKKVSEALTGQQVVGTHERTLSDSVVERQPTIPSTSESKIQHRKSCEVAFVLSSASTPTSETSFSIVSPESSKPDPQGSQKPGFTIIPISCQSLPTIPTPSSGEYAASVEESTRARAATICVSETDKERLPQSEASEMTQSAIVMSSSHETQQILREKGAKSKGKSSKISEESSKLPSSLSPDRRGAGRGKMGTVRVLCKQSISFDLGVSLYSQKSQAGETSPKTRQVRSWDPSESATAATRATAAARAELPSTSSAPARSSSPSTSGAASTGDPRPVSTSSEGEVPPASPTTAEKKRSRKFLDSSWLQKSKKFFKVSK